MARSGWSASVSRSCQYFLIAATSSGPGGGGLAALSIGGGGGGGLSEQRSNEPSWAGPQFQQNAPLDESWHLPT